MSRTRIFAIQGGPEGVLLPVQRMRGGPLVPGVDAAPRSCRAITARRQKLPLKSGENALDNDQKSLTCRKWTNAHNLDSTAPFARLLSLTPGQAVALVRAARSYQEAMWIAEGAPETAWLLFVSAVEIAANQWRAEDEDPVGRLRASRTGGEVERLLRERGGDDGDEFVAQVAALLADSMGATKKFTDFMMTFLPDPPAERPHEFYQLSWESPDMKKILAKVYGYRSDALHGGIPFPAPMCAAPHQHDGLAAETPGTAHSALGAVWTKKDLPMLLHTFEYIVRRALLKWWQSMIGQDGQPPVDEADHE